MRSIYSLLSIVVFCCAATAPMQAAIDAGVLSANPNPIPAQGTTTVTYENPARPNEAILITATNGGEQRTFTINTDGSGTGSAPFTVPDNWAVSVTFSTDDAPDLVVSITPPGSPASQ